MINVSALVATALASVGVQVCLGAWRVDAAHPAPPAVYIVYTFMTAPAGYDEDSMRVLEHYVYFHLWSSGDYAAVLGSMRTLLLAAGFAMIDERLRYEPETKMFDMACDYVYREEL
jgi:hypothetical protein